MLVWEFEPFAAISSLQRYRRHTSIAPTGSVVRGSHQHRDFLLLDALQLAQRTALYIGLSQVLTVAELHQSLRGST